MRGLAKAAAVPIAFLVVLAAGGLAYVKWTGLRGQPHPGRVETLVARAIRGLAVPSATAARSNPLPASPEASAAGREHFAHYCTMCHGPDGSGRDAPLGRGLFPKPPDMRADATQHLTDGELFYIIVNGVRFTGMPAFGTGTEDEAGEELAWQLVHFVRQLPRLTPEEVEAIRAASPL